MAQALWHVNSYPATATAASVTQPAAPAFGEVNRARHITFSAAGSATVPTGPIECVVRDGPTGTGTIIWTGVIQAAANASAILNLSVVDLRATGATKTTVGNALTAETTSAGATGTQLSVSMVGDVVQVGKPGFFP